MGPGPVSTEGRCDGDRGDERRSRIRCGFDQPGDLEGNHGFAHGGPADAELLREKLL